MTKKRTYLPMMLDVTDLRILLIGAGRAAAEKLNTLRQLQKTITVIAPEISDPFLEQDWIVLVQRPYMSGDIKGFSVVYAAVNDPAVEAQIAAESLKEGALLNVVDNVGMSQFVSPAALIREHFSIFVSTYGKGPGMSKRIRKMIQEKLDLETLDAEAKIYIEERNKLRD